MPIGVLGASAIVGGGVALLSDLATAALAVKFFGRKKSKETLHEIINGGKYEQIVRKDKAVGKSP